MTTSMKDEAEIGKGYRALGQVIYPAIPLAVAYYADTKWVVAAGFAALLVVLIVIADGRLQELCIRARRTNVLLERAQEQQKEIATWRD